MAHDPGERVLASETLDRDDSHTAHDDAFGFAEVIPGF